MTMTMKRMVMMIRRRIFNDEIVVIVLLEASRRVQGAKAEKNSRLQCPTQLASGLLTYLFFDSIGKIMRNVQERKRLDHGCFVGKEESSGKHHRRQH